MNMNYLQKGFIVPVLLVIIALLVVGGGVYIYENKKTETPTIVDTETQQSNQNQQPTNTQTPPVSTQPISQPPTNNTTNPPTAKISVVGMKQYTDANFGFSFWYPDTWKVQSTAIKNSYTGGTVQKTLTIAPPSVTIDPNNGMNGDAITIDEFSSPTREITIARDLCSPMSGSSVAAHRYYFDTNAHTWMVETPAYSGQSEKDGSTYNVPASTKAADVSKNTMGGLHMLGAGCSGYVIPLSAKNFVVYTFYSRNVGYSYGNIANTITATNPSVATPVSTNEQIKTITTVGLTLGGLGNPIGRDWISYNGSIYNTSGVLVPNVDINSFTPVLANGQPSGFAKDVRNVYVGGKGVLAGADPRTFQVIIGPNGHSTYFEKDKNYVWNIETIVAGADPNTFSIVLNPKNPTDDFSFFQKDATHVWDSGKVIQGADPASFYILNQSIWQSALFEADATHVWFDNLLIPGADPKTFIVDAYNTS
ncbi:MAG: DKNYY domain-containing protein, partial [Candidatus Nomurabacteria bacterium]|nr:DKNYY domain-containing protein [Candidatus Nomurabacteria bacterium]